MGFRFSRRIKIIPGVTLNVSKSGVSTSIGVKGAHVTLGHGKTRTTVGLPGTGVSYTETMRDAPSEPVADAEGTKNLFMGIGFIAALIFGAWLISRL
jgi:hypothetical protein